MATFDRKEDYLYIRWAKAVKNRDFHTCQLCGVHGTELNSHHLNSWNAFPEERYSIDNGITLCSGLRTSCHDLFHQLFGKGDNTREQFEEFEKIYSNISKKYNRIKFIKEHKEMLQQKILHDISSVQIESVETDVDSIQEE